MASINVRMDVPADPASPAADLFIYNSISLPRRLAGLQNIGLQPYRRTALLVEAPAGISIIDWPLIIDIDEQYYVKPDAGLLLISPADETPTPPCDVFPEEIDIATAVYRAELALNLGVRSVRRSWAGLRSFVCDRTPVAGFDAKAPGFFWLAGQGGYGIQTAPALARLAASMVMDLPLPADLIDCGVDPRDCPPCGCSSHAWPASSYSPSCCPAVRPHCRRVACLA